MGATLEHEGGDEDDVGGSKSPGNFQARMISR
jgi:hypothetical protein